ncbi:MAG TPA: hypothetical protein VF173_01095 [Thermoanaerobaculia bacterium]|nr:hypothetical protein [Thermoanaerobaculia bacterium]
MDDQDYELLLAWAATQRRKKRDALRHLVALERLAMQYEGARGLLLGSRDSKEIGMAVGLERSWETAMVGDFVQYLKIAANITPRGYDGRGT